MEGKYIVTDNRLKRSSVFAKFVSNYVNFVSSWFSVRFFLNVLAIICIMVKVNARRQKKILGDLICQRFGNFMRT